jgi:hypothetical protein
MLERELKNIKIDNKNYTNLLNKVYYENKVILPPLLHKKVDLIFPIYKN